MHLSSCAKRTIANRQARERGFCRWASANARCTRSGFQNSPDTFVTAPLEAAYAINELVTAASVIALRANNVAAKDSTVLPRSRTETFKTAARVLVHIPLSGITMILPNETALTQSSLAPESLTISA